MKLPLVVLMAALAAAAPASAATPERENALAFENGALLIANGGNYGGGGVGKWSAWYLTDGDEKRGWCSPQGKPTGLAFVWDLDTSWNLETIALSTRNMQESGYPGISAKTIELYAGDGTNFVKVGAFTVGKEERKEYPLPKGTAARQVKFVVTANHGNKEFSEVAEIELFGARAGTVAPPKLAGDFKTNYGPMRFVVDGDEVYGCYDYKEGADIFGSLAGRNARVAWVEYGVKNRQGNATFAVTADGAALFGVWYENGQLKDTWEGPRTSRDKGAKCTPRKKGGAFETLKKSGRLVLYGIRFDSNSDVPRPESGAMIDEVAGYMKQDANLRLLVEGHTDATNTAAYNLDLSQRRAQAVVAALVKRGVDASRLKPQGFGRTKPVADNESAQGRALNRRVEVSLLE